MNAAQGGVVKFLPRTYHGKKCIENMSIKKKFIYSLLEELIMKCENCGKNEVSFVYRSSINGKTEEHHLCQACAEKAGLHSEALRKKTFHGGQLLRKR